MIASKFRSFGINPAMTNSWRWLTRIFCHAPDLSPRSYRLPRRFATRPSSPCALTDWIRVGKAGVKNGRLADRVEEMGQHACLEDLAPDFERFGHYIPTAHHHS